MKPGSKLIIEIMDDGTIKLNGTGVIGTETGLLNDLKALAKEVGDGELKVEKHIHRAGHGHTHGDNSHVHGSGRG